MLAKYGHPITREMPGKDSKDLFWRNSCGFGQFSYIWSARSISPGPKNMDELMQIADRFAIPEPVVRIAPLGSGLVNDTFRMETSGEGPDYVLQRINHRVFRDVDLLQQNIERITSHIRGKLIEEGEKEPDRKVVRLIPVRDGALYLKEGENYWRVMVLVPRSRTHESIDDPRLAYDTGVAFGHFQSMLSDLPEGALGATIPNFHNIEFRLETFKETIDRDPKGRLAEVRWLVDELLVRGKSMCRAEELHRQGVLPKRVSHCDTKINNVLFDEEDRPLCVIDLDTTMPGFVISDFGDFIRTAGNTGAEDDLDLDRVGVDMAIFRAFSQGYIAATADFLTPIEKELLPFGAKLLTYMQTVRFLTDYLDGDNYYKIAYPTHNRQRSLAQFRLLQRIEEREQEMADFIASL